MINSYRENHDIDDDLTKAMYGNLGGMLGRLLYNMNRTCDIDNNVEEKKIGYHQIVGTYNQLKEYVEDIPHLTDIFIY